MSGCAACSMEMFVDGTAGTGPQPANMLMAPPSMLSTLSGFTNGPTNGPMAPQQTRERFENAPASAYGCQNQQAQKCMYSAQGELSCGRQ
jgi:hypothetical protein